MYLATSAQLVSLFIRFLTRDLKVMFRHIIVIRQEMDRGLRDLDIQVIVPWKDLLKIWLAREVQDPRFWISGIFSNLLVPPPSEKSAVHDPRFSANDFHCFQVCLNQGR